MTTLPMLESAVQEDHDAGPSFLPIFPFHMVWLATNACNLRCVHCSSNAARRLPNELSTQEAFDLFQQFTDVGVFDVAISGGEPLTRNDLFEIIEHAISLGIRVGVGSNGTTVTDRMAQRLKASGVDRLQISIDGMNEVHDEARRRPGLFAHSVEAIRRGIRAGLKVNVCFTAHRVNHHQLQDVIDACAQWGASRFNLSRFVPTGRGSESLDLSPREWESLMRLFYENRNRYRGQMEFTTHLSHQILFDADLACVPGFAGCQAGRAQGCIGPQGDVMPCVMLPLIVGNIRQTPLREIWETAPVLQMLRQRSAVKDWCNTCSFREKCGGCRAVAYAYTGDFLAADPRCWLFEHDTPS